jgi:lysine 2,3-aminomutase
MRRPAPFIGPAPEECAYLKGHPEIREVLVSGGDPLTAGDGELDALFASLRRARPGVLLRLCTRIPVTAPLRLGQETAAFLARWKPLRLAVHINHPRELEGPAGATLAACAGLGLPVLVQAVLLRGVNDRAETLAALFRECLSLGLTPYYLFQLDPAPGTDHFRVPLKEGLDLYEALKALLPGPGLPAYALDLPGGGGKIRLRKGVIAGETRGPGGAPAYLLPGPGGRLWPYPL